MNTSRRDYQKRTKNVRPLLLGLLVLGIAFAIFIPFFLLRTMMAGSGSMAETTSQSSIASPGTLEKITLEITSLPSNDVLQGHLLTKKDDGSYSRTQQGVQVQWDEKKIVMGNRSDVKSGAIVQVSGRVNENKLLVADQVVILTGFAQIS